MAIFVTNYITSIRTGNGTDVHGNVESGKWGKNGKVENGK